MKTKIKNRQERGITLIALVVTIVVLLILAGVSISLVLNNNGVISKSKDARDQYAEAQTNDEKQLNEVSDWIDTKVGDTTGGDSDYDPASEGVTIPDGFVYVGGTKASGLVISDATADKEKYKGQTTVGTDLVGNQFVWIPVDNIADYKRSAYFTDVATGIIHKKSNSEKIKNNAGTDYYYERLSTEEQLSVEANKGYYIGRYEAGDKESTETKKLRESGASTSNTITVKAGQAPYNYVTITQSRNLSEGFSEKQGYTSVKSKLVSSYAWDTAIAFIQKTHPNYGSSSEGENYPDISFSYTDISGVRQVKEKNSKILIPTGQTMAKNNIYDMGGNVDERTTEYSSDGGYFITSRGGSYNLESNRNPAGCRYYGSGAAGVAAGFRITLFL